jgi:hypothetical protein
MSLAKFAPEKTEMTNSLLELVTVVAERFAFETLQSV